jgi:flagellar hook-associated protein FlgK
MSSLGMVLNIATSALAAQQYCLDVTAHNIANVNTEGYSRQIPTLQGKQAVQYQGVILGLGVKTEQVTRSVDQFIENRLMQEKSNLSSSQETEKYMQVLEGIFSENSETSISSMLSDYWNLWNDVSNNPSGSSERIALYEHSVLISEQFKSLGPNLSQIQTDITNAVTVGVDRINEITSEIAQINVEIVGMEGNNNVANDLRDKRNVLVSELNEYLDIKTFEQDNHSLTIIAVRGCTLVQDDSNYELEMGGSNGDRVRWQDSGGNYVDITNYITNGKLGGWLELRDEIILKYELDLDAMAKEFIWSVNQQHSQGVGLEGFSTVTGTYAVTSTTQGIGIPGSSGAGLDYYRALNRSSFTGAKDISTGYAGNETLVIYENGTTVSITLNGPADIDAVITAINTDLGMAGVPVTASKTADGLYLVLTHDNASSGSTFGVATTSGNDELGLDQSFSIWTYDSDPANPPVENVINEINSSTTLAEIEIKINGIANINASITNGKLQITGTGGYTFGFSNDTSNVLAALGINTFFSGSTAGDISVNSTIVADKNHIAAAQIDATTGEFASGDNNNALAMADLQYRAMDISQWTCDRINGNTEGRVTTTIEDYYHSMVGSIGIVSSSISRETEFNEMMVNELNTLRNSVSAVSLDEEMTNLIKYQHAYQAAAKLITVSDEMLNTLISAR